MSLKTFFRVFRKAERRVYLSLGIVIFFFVLSIVSILWIDLLWLPIATILLCILLDAYSGKASEIPDKRDKSWVSWLQLEWLYQNYFILNYILSITFFTITIVWLSSSSYSLWRSVISAFISALCLPFALSIIFRIIKRDEFNEFDIHRSIVGRMCFAYLAERMVNLDRIREAIRYMEYSLKMLDSQCRENGFEAESVRKTIFLLEIFSSEKTLCLAYINLLRKLASELADSRTLDKYIAFLTPFLNAFKWFKDVRRMPPKRHLFLKEIVTSSIMAVIFTWLIYTFQNEIKSFLLSNVFLVWILPGLILLIIFFYLASRVPKYRVKLSDLEVIAEHFEEK
jgi:hypothetical protein